MREGSRKLSGRCDASVKKYTEKKKEINHGNGI